MKEALGRALGKKYSIIPSEDRKWVSVSKNNYRWLKEKGHVVRNKRSYDHVIADLIEFFEKHGGEMPK